jgi:hypothetical protein
MTATSGLPARQLRRRYANKRDPTGTVTAAKRDPKPRQAEAPELPAHSAVGLFTE